MDTFVVDAGVVAKLYLRDERDTDKADLLFKRFAEGNVQLIAPNIITYEVPAAISKGIARVKASRGTWEKALSSFESLGLIIIDDTKTKYDAMNLAANYSCHFYDAIYLLLSEDLGVNFITTEDKMVRNLKSRCSYITHLNSYK